MDSFHERMASFPSSSSDVALKTTSVCGAEFLELFEGLEEPDVVGPLLAGAPAIR